MDSPRITVHMVEHVVEHAWARATRPELRNAGPRNAATFRRVTTEVCSSSTPATTPSFLLSCHFLPRHHVPQRAPANCPPKRPARRPTRLAPRPPVHQHSAAGTEEQELEEPGCASGSCRRHNILLQHHRHLCRRAKTCVCPPTTNAVPGRAPAHLDQLLTRRRPRAHPAHCRLRV